MNKPLKVILDVIKSLLLVILSIITAWLLVPITDILIDNLVVPFSTLLPYDNPYIAIIVNCCLTVLCIACLAITIYKRKTFFLSQQSSRYIIVATLIIAILWIFERFLSHKWFFIPIYNTELGLVDLIIVTGVSSVILILSFSDWNNSSRKSSLTDSDSERDAQIGLTESVFPDSPISKEEEDELGRLPFAQKFIGKIYGLNTSKGARSLAITAPWGNGKTSFLNLVKAGLKKKGYKVVDILPWSLNPDKSITAHFFEEIIKKFGGIDHKVAGYLKKYSDMLESVNLGLLSNFTSNISVPELAQSISKAMNKSGVIVVVVFDDIDRLGANEIEEIFRIIRGSANFTNFIFLSAFDKRYVQQALKESNPSFNEHYIEKFFEMEFTLPELRKERIEKIIKMNIDWLSEADKKEFEEYVSKDKSLFEETPPYFPLTNLRMIYRWLNSLKYRYEILREECRISDLADLEMINLLYPQVYTLLAKDYNSFFECEDYQNTYKLWDDSMAVSSKTDWINSLRQREKRDLLTYCREEFAMRAVEIETLTKMFGRLLPKHRYHAEYKAFSNPNYTQRYFDGILDSTDIPQSEFNDMVSGKKSYMGLIDNDTDGQFKHSLFLLCFEAKPKDLNALKNLLSIIFYASSRYDSWGIPYYNIKEKLYHFSISDEYKKSLFKELMTSNKFSKYVFTSLVSTAHSDRYGWLEIFTEQECDDILSCLFVKAIDEKYSINDLSTLFFWTKVKTKDGDEELDYECKIEDIKSQYKKCLAKYSVSHIKYLIYTKHPEKDKFYPSTNFIQLWGTWKAYEIYMKQNCLLDNLTEDIKNQLNEFKDFLNKWKEKGEIPISYPFKVISPL